jgi:hypothetical protein
MTALPNEPVPPVISNVLEANTLLIVPRCVYIDVSMNSKS